MLETIAEFKAIPTQRSSIVRQIIAMRSDLVGYLNTVEKVHGSVWKNQVGGVSMISMTGPDALEFVWKNRDGRFPASSAATHHRQEVVPG